MGDRGGLGRSLGDIRHDLGMAKAGPPVPALWRHMARTAEALDRILEGADDNPVSEFGAEVSPEQLWARLILEEPEQRIAQLRGLLAAASQGARCTVEKHQEFLDSFRCAHVLPPDERAAYEKRIADYEERIAVLEALEDECRDA